MTFRNPSITTFWRRVHGHVTWHESDKNEEGTVTRDNRQTGIPVSARVSARDDMTALLTAFPEQNPNPVFCISKEGLIIYGNKASMNLFQEWCCKVGDVAQDMIVNALKGEGNKNTVEILIGSRLYAFIFTPVEGRDVFFLYGNDITDKRKIETELKKLATIIDESINLVLITDVKGNIEYVNSTFERITGYSRGEALGKNARLLASGETTLAYYNNLWSTILSGRTWRGVFKNKKKDGNLYWANGLISPIKNEDGDITNFMGIQEDISDKMWNEERLRYLSAHDSVTGIMNRNMFVETISGSILSEKPDRTGVVLQVNIDSFKLVNETYGHSIGDQFLKTFAEFLKERATELDMFHKPENKSFTGRVGGDEFGLFLFSRDEKEGTAAAEDIRRKVERFRFLDDAIRATVSIGIALYPDHGKTAAELLTAANAATERARALGQNRIYLFRKEDNHMKEARSSLEEKQMIITALEEDRFVPWFQPILDLRTHEVHHYEALARLTARDGSILPPSSFIFTAERYGLISGIDRVITEKTMNIQAQLSRIGKKVSFSMNLSGRHLGDEEMLNHLKTSIKESGADPDCIVFEITETAAVGDFKRAVEFVNALKDMGCKFSLDDFGVGFTSFVHLIEMEVDYIKIDGSFVRHLPEKERDRLLVRTIAEMARGLGIQTIAEFVDRESIMTILSDFSVDYAQGYLIGKPQPSLPD